LNRIKNTEIIINVLFSDYEKERKQEPIMADSEEGSTVYLAISNIPVALRSADLRNYFSQFIESGGFQCFHYRHRPEVLSTARGPEAKRAVKTCCCVASLHAKDADRFVKMYAGNHWIDPKGNWLSSRCVIKRVTASRDGERGLKKRFTEADLQSLPELNPPSLMQNGNVGTPVKVFLQLIQSCRLPPRLIRKLGLTFPKTSSSRRYGNVPFHYRDSWTLPATEETVFTAAGPTTEKDEPQKEEEQEEEDAHSNADDDDDFCEEWERHEALHEDVTSQERSKERLYEERIELKWEKGGSGLVFYTDAQYWQEEEGGTHFDEQTADDWDVDMSVYYDKDGGDMDARDYVRMRYEKRLREGLEDGSGHNQSIGSFEKFTKGFGRRFMEKQGWKDGDGLGNSQIGIPDALEGDGQHPNCKRGFGYHGEKL
uniref:G patch domain containing 3 n=1 Tax=Gasterosteus aculeatus TaxID=69293 RepID=G3NW27_GASAC